MSSWGLCGTLASTREKSHHVSVRWARFFAPQLVSTPGVVQRNPKCASQHQPKSWYGLSSRRAPGPSLGSDAILCVWLIDGVPKRSLEVGSPPGASTTRRGWWVPSSYRRKPRNVDNGWPNGHPRIESKELILPLITTATAPMRSPCSRT